jgi:FKBP-type peptidyl-prolyl cis-trans isomerase FkpA
MIKVSGFFTLLFLCLLLNSCNNNETKQIDVSPKTDQENNELIKNQFIKANQQLMQKENDEMDYYAKSHQLNFTRTGSGIRYFVYKPSINGDSIKDNIKITLNFTLKLMDGTLCYSSKTEGPRTFFVGHEDIESGIHKGLKYLKRGDKAILLIPSPLAHGLLGDFNKIPPQMPIVYDVEVD